MVSCPSCIDQEPRKFARLAVVVVVCGIVVVGRTVVVGATVVVVLTGAGIVVVALTGALLLDEPWVTRAVIPTPAMATMATITTIIQPVRRGFLSCGGGASDVGPRSLMSRGYAMTALFDGTLQNQVNCGVPTDDPDE